MLKYILIMLLAFCLPSSAQEQKKIKLSTTNSVNLRSEINQYSYENLYQDLQKHKTNDEFYLVVASGGGLVDVAYKMVDLLKNYPNMKILILEADSAAGMIVEALPNKRYVLRNSYMLFHEPKTLLKGFFSVSNLTDLVKDLTKEFDEFNQINYKRLGLTREEYEKRIWNTQWILQGHEIILNKAADEMVTATCSEKLKNSKEVVLDNLGPMTVTSEVSRCMLAD